MLPKIQPAEFGGRFYWSIVESVVDHRAPESLEFVREDLNNAANILSEMRQSWDNRLIFPLSKLLERYLSGDLGILLKGICEVRPNFGGLKFSLLVKHRELAEFRGQIQGECGEYHDQLSVLVDNVQLLDDPKGIIERLRTSVVRLKFFDDVPGGRTGDSLYFSLVSGNVVLGDGFNFEDRKLNTPWSGLPDRRTGKLPDDMIESGSKMVDNFSSQNTETLGDFPLSVVVNSLMERLVVVIGDDLVIADFEEAGNFRFKILDTLIGPV